MRLEVLCVQICVTKVGAALMREIGTYGDQIRNIFHPNNDSIRINLPDNIHRLHFNKYWRDSH